MTDPTQPDNTTDDDLLEVNAVVLEAMQVSTGDTLAVQDEAQSVTALAQSYETFVTQYSEAFAQSWEQTLQSYQAEVESWQTQMEALQAEAHDTLDEAASPDVLSDGAPLASPPGAPSGTEALLVQMNALKNYLTAAIDSDTPSVVASTSSTSTTTQSTDVASSTAAARPNDPSPAKPTAKSTAAPSTKTP